MPEAIPYCSNKILEILVERGQISANFIKLHMYCIRTKCPLKVNYRYSIEPGQLIEARGQMHLHILLHPIPSSLTKSPGKSK